jgi:hypothetical protein
VLNATELHIIPNTTTMALNDSIKGFSLDVGSSMLDAVSVREHLTLRNACIDYRDAGGSCWVPNEMPEASATVSPEQIPCLNKFENIIGHMKDAEIICFPLQRTNGIVDLINNLKEHLNIAISSGRLWALPGTVKYKLGTGNAERWSSSVGSVPSHHNDILSKLHYSTRPPLSVNITHAAMEADHYVNSVPYNRVFMYPHNAAVSIGLIGSLHDNECIDMSPGEEKIPNLDNREYRTDEYIGFICAGHTSHSTEAGRVRRVTCSTRVRVLSEENLLALETTANEVAESLYGSNSRSLAPWTLFCMGMYCEISHTQLIKLCYRHRLMSLSGPTPFSLHICEDTRLVNISISSGTLLKQCSNGYWADNVEVYKSFRVKCSIKPRIDTTGSDQMRACFSAYFNLIPYINENRAPRPLIASVQTPQAVCLPWCPGNAAVSPCHTFSPVTTTPLYSTILQDIHDGTASISSHLPGENVQCLFLNMEYTYEDAIIVSRRYVDNGGFSTMSLCSYNISRSEYVPPVGSTLCGVLSKWWKSPCQRGCNHDKESLIKGNRYVVGYVPTGVVHSITSLNNGDINVKVRSHQQLQDGDKLSMGHGQKGIAVITDYENMPIAYNPDHGQIIPDIVMGMSSVVTRQTNGLLYEAARSLSLFKNRESLPYVVHHKDRPDLNDEFIVRSGETGKIFRTLVYKDNGDTCFQVTKASLGIVRVFNQTQMSRERHQISHIEVSKYALRTPDGRARGGGVGWGEMEVQSTSSAGLQCADDEISARGDRIVGKCCLSCQRLGLLCTCTTEDHHVTVKVPYDLLITDCTTAIAYNGSFQYQLVPET